ncbi:hypothetical protein [Actinocorallia aurantiaca]|uniref:DUF262 domain-containing protein n=1 Tax=Actinocorallia aurantiaca TaxID=46204 RepID=A0ABN3UL23_9ACTN
MFDQPYTKLAALLQMLRDGDIDVVQFGRPFQRNVLWTAELWRSLARAPQRPINGFVWWLPPREEAPRSGRYRKSSKARVFIVDGQQRSTALAGGLGLRPACYPPQVWAELGGPELQVGVVLESARRLSVQPLRARKHPQVPLGALLEASPGQIPQLVTDAGAGGRDQELGQLAAELTDLRSRLLETEIPVGWLRAGAEDAADSYRVLNQGMSTKLAHASEIETLYLDLKCPGVRREVLDPLWRHARKEGYQSVVTLALVNELVQRQLPAATRRRSVMRASAERVELAARRAADACTGVIAYLQQRGLVGEQMLAMPSAIGVLMHLAAHFPECLLDDFPRRWLVHALAGGRYNGAPYQASRDVSAMLRATDYAGARAVLAELMLPAGPPRPLQASQLTGHRPGRFSAVTSLYAMAAAGSTGQEVQDLAEPDVVFPQARMRLVPLWRGALERSLGNFILATEQTAKVLEESGGWNRHSYEALRGGRSALASQHLPLPSDGPGSLAPAQLVKAREQELLALINCYLEKAGPLIPGEPT